MRFFSRLIVLVVIMAALGGAWVVYAGQLSPSGKAATVKFKEGKEIYHRLMATEPSFYFDDYGMMRVYGSIKNVGKEDCVYVKLNVEVRDKQGKLLKKLTITTRDILSNGTKSYDINGGVISESINITGKITEASFIKR